MISIIQAGLQQLSVPSDWLRECECIYCVYIYAQHRMYANFLYIHTTPTHFVVIHYLSLVFVVL